MRILIQRGEVDPAMYDFLLHPPSTEVSSDVPVEISGWMNADAWKNVIQLSSFKTFERLPADIVSLGKRWKEWTEHAMPENQPMPSDWKQLPPFEALMILRFVYVSMRIEG